MYFFLHFKIWLVVLLFLIQFFDSFQYGCESWTIKKADHWRINAFELWCWRRLLRVPWTARWSNQSILKEISPEYSLEGLMLKLKLQYFGHQMRRTDSFEETWCWEWLRVEGEGDNRGWDGWMASLTQWIWVWVSSRSWWWTWRVGKELDTTEQLNWTELNIHISVQFISVSQLCPTHVFLLVKERTDKCHLLLLFSC